MMEFNSIRLNMVDGNRNWEVKKYDHPIKIHEKRQAAKKKKRPEPKSKKPRISSDAKTNIMLKKAEKMKNKDIAAEVGCSISTVKRIIKQHNETGKVSCKPNLGAKKKISDEQLQVG